MMLGSKGILTPKEKASHQNRIDKQSSVCREAFFTVDFYDLESKNILPLWHHFIGLQYQITSLLCREYCRNQRWQNNP
jgi:hypothetical protein